MGSYLRGQTRKDKDITPEKRRAHRSGITENSIYKGMRPRDERQRQKIDWPRYVSSYFLLMVIASIHC